MSRSPTLADPTFTALLRSVIFGDIGGNRFGRLDHGAVSAAARRLKCSRVNLSNLLNGWTSLSVAMAARIEDATGYPAAGLLHRQTEIDLARHRAAQRGALASNVARLPNWRGSPVGTTVVRFP